VPHPLGVQGGAIKQRPHIHLFVVARQDIQLLLRPIVLSGETEQFEQEGALLGVRRSGAQFGSYRLNRFV
jgi:hypothetical protein